MNTEEMSLSEPQEAEPLTYVGIAAEVLRLIKFGTLVNFFMKAIGAFVVATLPYAILFGILFLALQR